MTTQGNTGNIPSISFHLAAAQLAVTLKDYGYALDCLVAARDIARTSCTIRMRLLATHCTIAIQEVIPLAVEQAMTDTEWTAKDLLASLGAV